MYYRLLNPALSYDRLVDSFEWFIGERYNVATHVERHVESGDPVALVYESVDTGALEVYRYSDLRRRSNELANALDAHGLSRGETIAVSLPQRPEAVFVHLAAYKLGAIVVPLTTQFGRDAYRYRLGHSQARVLVTTAEKVGDVEAVRDDLDALETIVVVDPDDGTDHRTFAEFVADEPTSFDAVETNSTDPAAIFYTSGTTGDPKGVVQSHQHVLGNHPGVKMFFNYPEKGERIWGPADWSWAGGYLALLIPPLTMGMTVVANDGRFDPLESMAIIERHDVQHTFLPPTALKRIIDADGASEFDVEFRSIMSGGESLPPEVLSWWEETYGVVINEMYGQTEADSLTSNCGLNYPVKPGSIGKPVPGRSLEIIDEDGAVLGPDEVGEIALERPDPAIMSGYYDDPERTDAQFTDEWFRTGDLGKRDEDGYFYFVSRKDELIISSGYRISPVEVENTLIEHPAVSECAVVGVPDQTRGQLVTAFVKPARTVDRTDELTTELQEFVKERLAAYEYPREIEFVDDLPTTVTGKVKRSELLEE